MRRTTRYDAEDVQSLLALIRRVQATHTLEETLRAIVDGVVSGLGFGAAAINLRRPDGSYRIEAVAGDEPGLQDLLGVQVQKGFFEAQFALGERWGELIFVSHDRGIEMDAPHTWVPDLDVLDDGDAWHPLDALFVPLRSPNGEMFGVLSVDLPPAQRHPDPVRRDMLEMFAEQAGIAVERVRQSERLVRSESDFRLAFEGAVNGIMLAQLAPGLPARGAKVNSAFCHLFGYTAEEIQELAYADFLHPDDPSQLSGEQAFALLQTNRGGHEVERMLRRKDGTGFWASVKTSLVEDRPDAFDAFYAITTVEDISDRRSAELQLRERVGHDALTGVLNRHELAERLRRQGASINAAGRSGALLFCDIDHFKNVNDSFGHTIGDEVLVEVATRIADNLREGDSIIRVGGDEFLLLVLDVSLRQAHELADRIAAAVYKPIHVEDQEVRIRLTVGVATRDRGQDDADALVRAADRAMYRRKSQPTI